MIERTITDPMLIDHLRAITADASDLFLTNTGGHRIVIVHATHLVNQMVANHYVRGDDAEALGFGYVLVLLAASSIKNPERTDGDAPCRRNPARRGGTGPRRRRRTRAEPS